jgi:hypothetical protein
MFVIHMYMDATLASAVIAHEAALHLKFWVWFYRIEQVLFWYYLEKQGMYLVKELLVFSTLLWYIF